MTWRAEHEPFGNVYEMRSVVRTEQPLRFPGQEVAMTLEGQEENYNIFRWYRSGWGRYSQADPIGFKGGDINLFGYALGNPLAFVDPLGLAVRVCCRKFGVEQLEDKFDHCYVQSDRKGPREAWGLYGRPYPLYFPSIGVVRGGPLVGWPQKDAEDDDLKKIKGNRCGPWLRDCSSCLDKEIEKYPAELYSLMEAPLRFGNGRNSNTFVRCLLKKCGVAGMAHV